VLPFEHQVFVILLAVFWCNLRLWCGICRMPSPSAAAPTVVNS